MLRILRQPRWIALISAIPIGVMICLLLSNWQWHRYESRKGSNHIAGANMDSTPKPVLEAMPVGNVVTAAQKWLPVTATGKYLVADQVLVRQRPMSGSNGFWVITPLITDSGNALLVNRGWMAATGPATQSPPVPLPPTGAVTVVGYIQPDEGPVDVQPTDLPTGQVLRVDVAAITVGIAQPALSGYINLSGSTPTQAAGLTPIPLPNLDDGPHLSYSMQWITFAVMFFVGLILLIRREIMLERQGRDQPSDDAGSGQNQDRGAGVDTSDGPNYVHLGEDSEVTQDSRH